MGFKLAQYILGGPTIIKKTTYEIWITRADVYQWKKDAADLISKLVTKLGIVSGAVGLLLSSGALRCRPTWLSIGLIFVGMFVNLTAKINTYLELQELGVKLKKAYLEAELESNIKLKLDSISPRLTGESLETAKLEAIEEAKNITPPNLESWRFVAEKIIEAVGLALLFILGEIAYTILLPKNPCGGKK